MPEFELKFQVPAARAAAVAAALHRGAVQEQRLQARYYDTHDRALAARGAVLRLRKEDGQWVQAAKAPGANAFERLEHEVPLPEGALPQPDPARHADHPVGACLREALGQDPAPLECFLETDITRVSRRVGAGGSAVEIALDRGELRAGQRIQPVLEIEFELKEGSGAALVELAGRWCERHGLWLDPLSKSAAGGRLAQGLTQPPPVHSLPPRLQVHTATGFAAAALRAGLDQSLANARELAAGIGGDGHVHQLRVGLRRLRTTLRELEALGELAPLAEQVEPALRELFQVLGQHRDRSTLVPALQREVVAAGGPQLQWQPELPDVGAALRQPAVQSAWLQLLAAAHRLEQVPEQASPPLKAAHSLLRKRLHKLHASLLHDGRRFERLEETARHTVRKRAKRLRYLAELSQPLFEADAIHAFVRDLKALQDALGLYQDEVVGRELLRERAAQDPAAWFAVGWLTGREPLLARQCAKACRRAAEAKVFWE
ncbi:CYTH and CHAD domain-containing protein [Ramlibacter sp. AN1133]|uniref:CYTH and CHAD domain-containing protein n=1 Tax=Ramlibacter sp. AN1133 TaxID=3133429 RepID=UPI0030BC6E64